MVRPTLQDGDIWSDELANASIRPFLSTLDEPGAIALIIDDNLTGVPGNIKPNFYDWYNRLQLTATGGLNLTYQGIPVRLPSGNLATLEPGALFLTDNSTGFIFLSADTVNTVSIKAGSTLPVERILIASYVTADGIISALVDAREQKIATIAPMALATQSAAWLPGDRKTTFRNVLETGWLYCLGQSLSKIEYPDLFDAIGYTHGGSGNTFFLPNCDERYFISSSTLNNGDKFGSSSLVIAANQLPRHTHAVLEADHLHGFASVDHSHQVIDGLHGHQTIERPHNHATYRDARRTISPIDNSRGGGAEVSAEGTGASLFTERVSTDVSIVPNQSNIQLGASLVNGAVRPARTNITVLETGNSQAINSQPRSIVGKTIIKL